LLRAAPLILTALFLFPNFIHSAPIDVVWSDAQAPENPALSQVTITPGDTALLILDIEELTCNTKRRPRCLETVPRIADLMTQARKAGVAVIYSLTSRGTPRTILPQVTPEKGEAIVQSSVDKFWKTDLEKILLEGNIRNVIITGTAAHGAVMHTATAAGFRGMGVILPVDCLSAKDLYTEQATVQLLKTGPGTRKRITLTSSRLISFP
jgi:nicotinamidase-related amidase